MTALAPEKAKTTSLVEATPIGLAFSNDPQVIRDYFISKGLLVEILGTDSFLKASRDSYPTAWIAREIGANLADRNPAPNQGTINGIEFKEQKNKDGSTTIEIICPWQFSDMSGAILNHSDKTESGPDEVVGGNGIGMKQAAVRYARDLAVQFEVHGGNDQSGWIVAYDILKADSFNKSLSEVGLDNQYIKHNYFIAKISAAAPTRISKYVFRTANEEVLDSLRRLNEIIICDSNPYIKNADFKREKEAIKWILPADAKAEVSEGRLFINGQVFGYKEKGSNNEEYWKGPEGVTVQLNNIKYPRNMDRPPVSIDKFDEYLSNFLRSLSVEEVVQQLKKSEPLWTSREAKGPYDYSRAGWQVVVEGLIRSVQNTYARNATFQEYKNSWTERKFVARYSPLSDLQVKELKDNGYHLCPSSFVRVGMADARSFLTEVEKEKKVSTLDSGSLRSMAKDVGIPVATRNINVDSMSELMAWFKRELGANIESIKVREDGVLRINFKDLQIPEDLLGSILFDPNGKEQLALQKIRSFVLKGLSTDYPSWISTEEVDAPTSVFSGVRTIYSSFADRAQGKQLSIINDEIHGQACYLEFKISSDYINKLDQIAAVAALAPESRDVKVATEGLEQIANADQLFKWAHKKLAPFIDSVDLSPDGLMFIDFKDLGLGQSDLDSQIYRPRTEGQLALYALRSFICAGLSNAAPSWINENEPPRSVFGRVSTTYSVDTEAELSVSNHTSSIEGNYLRFKIADAQLSAARHFAASFKRTKAGQKSAEVRSMQTKNLDHNIDRKTNTGWWVGVSGLLTATVVSFLFAPDSPKAVAENNESKSRPSIPGAIIQTTSQGNLKDRAQGHFSESKDATTAEYLKWKQRNIERNSKSQSQGLSVDQLISQRDNRDSIRVPAVVSEDNNPALDKAQRVIEEFATNGDVVKDFKILSNPTQEQSRKLNLLSEYLSLVAGVSIPNELFIFQGAGAYGLNFEGKAIGLHAELLKPLTPFHRALQTFIHEVAHNVTGKGHGPEWMAAQSGLYADSEQKLFQILSKQRSGELLTDREMRILELRDSWRLRQ